MKKNDKHKQGAYQLEDQKRQKQDKTLTCFHCHKPIHFKKDFTNAILGEKIKVIISLVSIKSQSCLCDY